MLVENKPGANAAIGADYVAKSEPDGYTLFLTTISAVAMNPHLRADLPYDPVRDYAPVTRVILTTEILVVSAKAPVKTTKELVDLAKERNGGLPMESTGVGSLPHLALELFQQSAGIKVVHVPYRGAAPAVTDIIGGQVMGAFLDLPVVMPQIVGGNLRALGTASAKRDEVLPDVPTLDEQGYRDVYADNWYALFAPAHTPAPVIAKLNAAFRAALDDPEVRRKLWPTAPCRPRLRRRSSATSSRPSSPAGARSSASGTSRRIERSREHAFPPGERVVAREAIAERDRVRGHFAQKNLTQLRALTACHPLPQGERGSGRVGRS